MKAYMQGGSFRTRLIRKSCSRQSGRQFQGVLIVELLQDGIGQADAVQLPERVVVAVIVEVLVVGLEHAPVVRILVGLVAVLSEQDPILVLDEELVRGARLAAEVVQHRRYV